MVISLGPEGPVHANADGSRPLTSASNLIAVTSEIAAGRIALFSRPRFLLGRNGCCCTRRGLPWRQCGLSTRVTAPLRLSPDTLALCSSDFPLPSRTTTATILSPHDPVRLSTRGEWLWPLAGGRRAPGREGVAPSATVPKGRLELPRVSSLRPERSASAISPLRHDAGQRPRGADLGTRTPDLLFTKQLLYRLS